MIYETNRLIIRVLEEADYEDVKQIWGNEEVMEHCLGAISHELLPEIIRTYIHCQAEKGLSVYAVVEKESSRVIGAAGFNVKDSLEEVEMIYHFSKEVWGRGYASETGAACLNIAKQTGKVKKIYASASPHNPSSIKILEKIGFDFIGLKWFEDTKQEEPYYEMVVD
ncbi:GNAT family N-acetyltransferase [Bacillus salitolerans]|uniref:GNAT family N-acetyltransferase n=1 Tax=Bacillus salitolerans TaxID=1437434 RepID=A0ABW4LV53_9BACI